MSSLKTLSPEMNLYTIAATSLLQPTFYTPNTNDLLNKIKTLIRKVDPIYVAKLAVYSRTELDLRTIPFVLLVELAKLPSVKGTALVKNALVKSILRADELAEVLELYRKANGNSPLSNQVRKGIAKSFNKFNEYHFSKYKNGSKSFTLRDVMFLTHPKPNNTEEEVLFNKIADSTLETPYTWETELTEVGKRTWEELTKEYGMSKKDILENLSLGSKALDLLNKRKKAIWENLIDSKKIGYMALLRNLRNIEEARVSEDHINKVANFIKDEREVLKSKQLPFRFLSAYKYITNVTLSKAVEKALDVSIQNIPDIGNFSCLIASDVSGSMRSPISEKSMIMNFELGAVLSCAMTKLAPNSTIGIFGQHWLPIELDKKGSVLKNVTEFFQYENKVGFSTLGHKALDWAIKNKKDFDKLFFFTDMQMQGEFDRYWSLYKQKINSDAKIYLFNLAPYGAAPLTMKGADMYLISGWNDSIFKILNDIDNPNVVEYINKTVSLV